MSTEPRDGGGLLLLTEVEQVEVKREGRWMNIAAMKDGARGPRRYVCFSDEEAEEFRPFVIESTAQVLVAPLQNTDYDQFVSEETARLREIGGRAGGLGAQVSTEAWDRIIRDATARHLLLDWRGLGGPDGQPLRYTPTLAAEWLKRDPGFMNAIRKASELLAEQLKSRDEKDAADLGNGSGGSSNGAPTSQISSTAD